MTLDELDAIYKKYGAMVERQARRVVRDPVLAQDVAQEVFMRFIVYSSKTEVTSVSTLLYRMATQSGIKRLKHVSAATSLTGMEIPADGRALAVHDGMMLKKLLSLVDAEQAEIAAHYFMDGMSQHEIASLMDMSRKSVGRQLEAFCKKAQRLFDFDDKTASPTRSGADNVNKMRVT